MGCLWPAYANVMTPKVAELLETAERSLSPDERVDLAAQLLRSANTDDAVRLDALRRDVAAGLEQIDRGEGVEVAPGDLRDYLRGLGREASARLSARRTA